MWSWKPDSETLESLARYVTRRELKKPKKGKKRRDKLNNLPGKIFYRAKAWRPQWPLTTKPGGMLDELSYLGLGFFGTYRCDSYRCHWGYMAMGKV